ncbi:MAG: hypothetical protein IKJ68_05520 [Clostridia bacterium]|nr:hypothetical protein [Clostridia bacterium]
MVKINPSKNEDIIKNLLKGINPGEKTGNLSENDIRQKIKGINKNEVIKKLNSMGLGSAAKMLERMSDEDILRELSKNPAILKKLNQFLK